jgi:hypothetical protein
MSRKYHLTFTCVGLVLIGCVLAVRVWPPALSAAAACRHLMEHTEGYGLATSKPLAPWRRRRRVTPWLPISMGSTARVVTSISTARSGSLWGLGRR